MLRTALALVALSLVMASPFGAAAQRGIDVERLRPALDADGFIGVQGTRTPGHGRWNFQLFLDWTVAPLLVALEDEVTLEDESTQGVIDHRVGAHFQFQVGLGPRLALGLDAPVVFFQDADAAPLLDGGGELAASAAGNPRLLARYKLLGESSEIERERPEGPGLALQLGVAVPVATDDTFAADRGTVLEAAFIGDFHILGAAVGAQLGTRFRLAGPEMVLGTRFEHEIELGLALMIPIPVMRGFAALIEARWIGDLSENIGFTGPTNIVEGDLAVRFERGDTALTVGVGTGFSDGVGSPALRTFLALAWAPRFRDADGDGIPDDEDQCQFLPEDFDGFEDEDGCLDPDNDNDLIPDADDLCPNEEAEEFRDEDEDGCTDPFVDGDRDGVADADDACPGQPEDRDGHQDDDGCPDPDNDGDGILDVDDRCPGEPEDRDGFEDDDGCPDPDNDGDGMLDADDRCPNEAEDRDGFEDDDGCPDVDNDHDGVRDEADQCPDAAETINGVDDDDGCPDRGGRALWRATGTRGEEGFALAGAIRFGPDGAIRAASAASVAQLALHITSLAPSRVEVSIGSRNPDAGVTRSAALVAALEAYGIPSAWFWVVVDAARGDARVVVRPAPVPPVEAAPVTSEDGPGEPAPDSAPSAQERQ